MASKGFSINIDSLPVTDGLGPVAEEVNPNSTQVQKMAQPMISRGTGSVKGIRPNDVPASRSGRNSIPFAAVDGASPTRASAMSQAMSGQRRSSSPFGGSPSRNALRSASPRHLSPATSQIFERDVQESTIAPELSDAIPAHIQTEDHIPAVLEASSLAITDTRLDPSDVEIVMHAGHQPASASVAAATEPQPLGFTPLTEPGSSPPAQDHADESNPNYGTVDPLDPRRLSFISFADVVHAKHDSHFGSTAPSVAGGRSPSPGRSPVPHGSHSGYAGSMLSTLEAATPMRRGSASIVSPHAQTHGDLTIETMQQSLEQPLTAISAESGALGRSHR